MPFAACRPTSRSLYLCALGALQLALLTHIAPPLARTFKLHSLYASLHDGWPAAAHFAGVALAVAGASVALVFPLLALLRHHKRGRLRFLGLPRWAIRIAIAGGMTFALAMILGALAVVLQLDARGALAAIAQSTTSAGTAMMAAGALCAELLRRSVSPIPVAKAPWQCVSARLEALDPLEPGPRVA